MKKLFITICFAIFATANFAQSKSWEYVDKYEFSGVDLNSSPKTFSNLQGDIYDYRLYITMDGDSANITGVLYLNNDTSSNYRNYLMQGYSTTTNASVSDSVAGIFPLFVGSGSGDYRSLAIVDILGSSGEERIIPLLTASNSTSTPYVVSRSQFWKNTADELTSIVFSANVTDVATGEIYLFRRQKESVYNASDWKLIEKQNVSASDINGTPITFDNLQGDEDDEYKLEVEIIDGTGAEILEGTINGDSGSNYTYQNLENTSGTLSANTATTTNFLNVDYNTTTPSFIRAFISAKSGVNRAIRFNSGGNASEQQISQVIWWTNTADEITSIELQSATASNTTAEFRLYKRSKNRSTTSHERLIYDYDIEPPANYVLLAHADGTDASTSFPDSSNSNHTITANGDAQVDTAQSKFGGASALFDGTGDYLSIADSTDWDLSADFTIDFWVRFNSLPATIGLIGQYNSTGWQCYISGGNLRLYSSTEGASVSTAFSPSTATWYHIAIIRSGSNVYLAIDGTLSSALSDRTTTGFAHALTIGAITTAGGSPVDGWIDEVRIVKGEALWTANFTAPTKATNDFSSGHTFQNLNTNNMYRIDTSGLKSSADFRLDMLINGDSGSNYEYQYVRGNSTTADANTGTEAFTRLGVVSSDYPGIGSLLLFPKSGKYRPMIKQYGYEFGGSYTMRLEAQWWKNTAADLFDIKPFASASTPMQGNIKIWEIQIPEN